MNPLFRIDFSISDSLKIVRKSVLIYETIIIYKNRFPRQFPQLIEGLGHFRHNLLRTGAKMQGAEPGKGGMVRGFLPIQQPHEVDVPPAGLLHFPAGIYSVHVSVDKDLDHLVRCWYPFFFRAAVCPVQVTQKHAVYKLAQ